MITLNFPTYSFKIREEHSQTFIFDDCRKKYVKLTPEEWVRQHFLQWLITEKQYPKSLIQVEKSVRLNTLLKRTDILLYNSMGDKILLVECKSPYVSINQASLDQIAMYNMAHQVGLLAVTNGLTHFFIQIDLQQKAYQFLADLPNYCSL